jgi:uncharacterized protein YkwD
MAIVFAAPRAQAASSAPEPDIGAALASPDLDPGMRARLEVYELVNEARADAGLPPYRLDARLMSSAQEHSADMASGAGCRHRGSDGSSSRSRIRRHGYPHGNWAGENIVCSRRTPFAAVGWWLASGPHRRNLLHGHYTHIGVGYAPNGPYGPMWTLNFGAGAADTVHPELPGRHARHAVGQRRTAPHAL